MDMQNVSLKARNVYDNLKAFVSEHVSFRSYRDVNGIVTICYCRMSSCTDLLSTRLNFLLLPFPVCYVGDATTT